MPHGEPCVCGLTWLLLGTADSGWEPSGDQGLGAPGPPLWRCQPAGGCCSGRDLPKQLAWQQGGGGRGQPQHPLPTFQKGSSPQVGCSKGKMRWERGRERGGGEGLCECGRVVRWHQHGFRGAQPVPGPSSRTGGMHEDTEGWERLGTGVGTQSNQRIPREVRRADPVNE